MTDPACRCGHGLSFHRYSIGMGACDFDGKCPNKCVEFDPEPTDDYGWRVATSVDDLKIGQVIASYSTMEGGEELVRGGRVVGFARNTNVEVDNESGGIKEIGFTKHNTVFILADPPEDPAEEAWTAWSEAEPWERRAMHTPRDKAAFIAGWKANEES